MKKRRWTQEELDLLKEGNHHLIKDRSKSSIVNMLKRLNLRPRFGFRKPWCKEHIEILRKMKQEGKTPKQICQENVLPYSSNAIKKQLGRLGLCKKKIQNRFSKEAINKFKSFLLMNYENNTPNELTNLWNKKNSIKTNKHRVIHYLVQLKIKLPKREITKLKNNKKYAKLLKFLEENWKNNTPEELANSWNEQSDLKVSKGLVCIKLRKLGIKISQKEVMAIKFVKNKEKDLLKVKTKKAIEQIKMVKMKIMQRRLRENKDIWTGLPTNEICLDDEQELQYDQKL